MEKAACAEEEALGKPPVPPIHLLGLEKDGSEKRAAGTIVCHLQLHQRGINGLRDDLVWLCVCRKTLKEQN